MNTIKTFVLNPRRGLLFIFDLLVIFTALWATFFLRFDGNIPSDEVTILFRFLPFLLVSSALSFIYFGFYNRFWEYSSLEDMIQIIKGVSLGTLVAFSALFIYDRAILVPRSILIIEAVLGVVLIGSSRLVWRLWRESLERKDVEQETHDGFNTLIIGAGNTGAHLLKYLKKFSSQYDVLGFLDKDSKKWNSTLRGIKVFGGLDQLPALAREKRVKIVLIAIGKLSFEELNEMVNICNHADLKYKVVSSVKDMATQETHITRIRQVEVSDLLGREPVALDLPQIQNLVKGRKVLVTGAGGSIGSELCSQILEFGPSNMVMLDKGENYLYDLGLRINSENLDTKTQFVFCSVTNAKKLEEVFQTHRPDLVFHAAAHKHVPIMEENVDEAIINNVYGTRLTADLAEKYEVDRFVQVSTDKVVNPTSIMGMTKNLCERYVQYKALNNSRTKFITVRFGNVLGSNGSVVRLFKNQIQEGGPVTVTHPEMERFFMLIPEAVQLILQAATLGQGGEIFLLDMGKPVKIVDLARQMIRLSGYVPDQEIKIKFCGIRPGEKLYEELVADGEKTGKTSHSKINRVQPYCSPNQELVEKIDALCQDAVGKVTLESLEIELKSIVNEYSFGSVK